MMKKYNVTILTLLLVSAVLVPIVVFQGCGSDEYAIPTSDPNAPIAINGGAASTTDAAVTLTLHRADAAGVIGYFVSENATAPTLGSSWVTVTQTTTYDATGIPFTLSAGAGTKTVYAWFKNANNEISTAASDTITVSGGGGGY